MLNLKKWKQLVGNAAVAVNVAQKRSFLWQEWNELQEKDADGNPRGPLPYTDEALAAFHRAECYFPDDVNICHHLAIGHHARAWDYELRRHPGAPGEWEKALGYWRGIGASGEFWRRMKEKLLIVDPQADTSYIDALRKDMLENLLDIHVDFVRHYFEGGEPARANVHVDIVRRAQIPPAVKKRLTEKLFKSMTASVSESLDKQAFDSALAPVEQFLSLFENYLPALRRHAEICHAWLSRLSYADDWDAIIRLSQHAMPPARRLTQNVDLPGQPLAIDALEEMAVAFVTRGNDRGNGFLTKIQNSFSDQNYDLAMSSYNFAMDWINLIFFCRPNRNSDSAVISISCSVLNNQSCCQMEKAGAFIQSNIGLTDKIKNAIPLIRSAVDLIESALRMRPEDRTLINNHAAFQDILNQLTNQLTSFG